MAFSEVESILDDYAIDDASAALAARVPGRVEGGLGAGRSEKRRVADGRAVGGEY